MAIFQSAMFSSVHKKFGNLTTYRSRGVNIVRCNPLEVRNPRTLAQRKHRLCFGELTRLSSYFQDNLLTGFPKGYKVLAMNAFTHENADVITIADDLKVTIDHRRLVFAVGEVTPPDVQVVVDMKAHTASFTSTPQLVSYNASKDDKIYLLLWEPEQQESICVAWKTRRDPMPTVVDLPETWQQQNLYIYTYAVTASRKRTSNTVLLYAGGEGK